MAKNVTVDDVNCKINLSSTSGAIEVICDEVNSNGVIVGKSSQVSNYDITDFNAADQTKINNAIAAIKAKMKNDAGI